MKRTLQGMIFAIMLLIPFSNCQAQGMPTFDAAHILQSILNTADQLRQWNQSLSQAREGFALAYAVSQGIKDWRSMSWQDMLSVFEMPWFDGIDGIDDIRNMAAATGMTLEELQNTFSEVDKIHRMMTSPMYLQNQAYQAKCRLWATTYSRIVKRRMALTKMHQKYLEQVKKLKAQAQYIQKQLDVMTGMDPVPTAAINLLTAKLALIHAQLEGDKEAISAQEAIIKKQEEQEVEVTAEKIGKLDDENSSRRRHK